MKKSILAVCVVVMAQSMGGHEFALAAERGAPRATYGMRIPARALPACVVAHEEFQKFGYDVARFDLIVEDRGQAWEIIFEPRRDLPEESRLFGGETSAGREVHYYVNKIELRIERFHFAR